MLNNENKLITKQFDWLNELNISFWEVLPIKTWIRNVTISFTGISMLGFNFVSLQDALKLVATLVLKNEKSNINEKKLLLVIILTLSLGIGYLSLTDFESIIQDKFVIKVKKQIKNKQVNKLIENELIKIIKIYNICIFL